MAEIIRSMACVISDPKILIESMGQGRALNPRATEGDVIELTDGRLLLVYSHYYGGGGDHDPAEIRGTVSRDGGKTWGASYVIQANDARYNVMSVSLFRMRPMRGLYPGAVSGSAAGGIGMVYVKNNGPCERELVFRASYDEGLNWSAERVVSPLGNHPCLCVINGGGMVLSCGRILLPVYCLTAGLEWSSVCYSDDDGFTWQRSRSEISVKLQGASGVTGFCEPNVGECGDGRLVMMGRTLTGRVWKSVSEDRGVTWSEAKATALGGSASPCAIERVPSTGDLMVVWNQASEDEIGMGLGRSRLTVGISKDGGERWGGFWNLESLDDRTEVKAAALGAMLCDKSEDIAIATRTRIDGIGIHQTRGWDEPWDLSVYPYAQKGSKRRGYMIAEYPSITFISGDRVVVTYDALGGEWNFEGPRSQLGEGEWTNEERLPGLVVQVIPVSEFYR